MTYSEITNIHIIGTANSCRILSISVHSGQSLKPWYIFQKWKTPLLLLNPITVSFTILEVITTHLRTNDVKQIYYGDTRDILQIFSCSHIIYITVYKINEFFKSKLCA